VEAGVVPAVGEVYFGAVAHGGVQAVFFQGGPVFWAYEVDGGDPYLGCCLAEIVQGDGVVTPAANGVSDVAFEREGAFCLVHAGDGWEGGGGQGSDHEVLQGVSAGEPGHGVASAMKLIITP